MPIYRGGQQVTKMYRGATEITRVYRGATVVFDSVVVTGNPFDESDGRVLYARLQNNGGSGSWQYNRDNDTNDSLLLDGSLSEVTNVFTLRRCRFRTSDGRVQINGMVGGQARALHDAYTATHSYYVRPHSRALIEGDAAWLEYPLSNAVQPGISAGFYNIATSPGDTTYFSSYLRTIGESFDVAINLSGIALP